MKLQKRLPLSLLAATALIVGAPPSGFSGSRSATMTINVDVRPSSSFKVQNAADLAPVGFTSMFTPPVLVINAPPVIPEVIIEVSADAAGSPTSKPVSDLTGEFSGHNGGNGEKQVSLKDLGVASPPASRRTEGTDLKEAFERAAGEIIYRLDLLNKVNVGRQSPVVISINL